MEEPKTKRALLYSIETRRRELILSEERRLNALRKGKSRKTQQDSEREDELAKALKDLADNYRCISESESTGQRRQTSRLQPNVRSSVSNHHDAGGAQLSTTQSRNAPPLSGDWQPIVDEPVWNPFTSSYAYRETGFEPGPSNSKYHTLPEDVEDEAVEEYGEFVATVSDPGVLERVTP